MKSESTFLSFIPLAFCCLFLLSSHIISQDKSFIGTQTFFKDGKISFQTIPAKNNEKVEIPTNQLYGKNSIMGEQYVLGGTVLWSSQVPLAIANFVAINNAGNSALTGWGLNEMRATLYTDANNIPVWEFDSLSHDPVVDISGDGNIIAAAIADTFCLLNPVTGAVDFQLTLPDSFYASVVSVARDGSMVVLLANALGNSNTARIYALDLSGTPSIRWMFDVPVIEIANWTGANFSADGSEVAITGRNHLYVFNSVDGTLIWDHFLDNTESAPAISGDGKVIVTADLSGFVHTWYFNPQNNEYDLLWKYRIPPGASTNWATSVGISADGETILAGTLIFLSNGNDGSIIAFDTYGDGTPKWVYNGVGDYVDNISVSDDGRVAAAVTWGDLAHTLPDLLVFDVETGALTFTVVTPGSFFTCDMSPDGNRVFAGGKAIARQFGNGGRIYLCDIDLGGGNVSGNVDLTNTSDDSGVLVKVVGTPHSAVTDVDGNYLIENIPIGTYTVKAEKPGYEFGSVTNVTVTEGSTTFDVDFSLDLFPTQPPTLSASTGLSGVIMLSWTSLFTSPEREREIALMVGDTYIDNYFLTTTTSSVSGNKTVTETSPTIPALILADSIAVYRSFAAGGPYQRIGSVAATQTSYSDSNVLALRNYYYVVNIFNDIGQSYYSNEAVGNINDSLLTFSIDVPEASIPTIDGILSPGEWDDAFKLDISDIFGFGGGIPGPHGSTIMYFKIDETNDMLYVAGEDFLNSALDDREGFGLYFDDNNNDVFDGAPPYISEGNFWAYWHPWGSDLVYRELSGTSPWDTLENAQVEFTINSGHLQGEVAIPMGFMEGYQLQVFSPDKIVGLGAFIIARQGGVAIFNGWWPQTMNTLFNPVYFGDVGIDVSLIAPPQAPSNISVERRGEDLLLTWTDPVLGLNNDPLPVPPTINIYKNGVYLTSFPAGVESFQDVDVHCVGWYEYQLEAVIQIADDTLVSPITIPVGEFACEEPVLVPISYDDDQWDGFYAASFNWENNKFAVRFTPSTYPTYVRRLKTTVNSNDDFDFTVQADSGGLPGKLLAGPYRVYDTGPAIVGIITKNIPADDPPQIAQGDFWVVINWFKDTPGAPGIGVDMTLPLDGRSMQYLSNTGWVNFTPGDIMITAYVSDQPVGVGEENNEELPLTFDLKQNYPNPSNPTTIIGYEIPNSEMVTLEVYNALGQKVHTLVNEMQEPGQYEVVWDGKNNSGNSLSSGIYLYRIVAGNYVKVMKMVLLK